MSSCIYVINPNSSQTVTDGISRALEPLRIAGAPRIVCESIANGPAGVQTQQDVDNAAVALVQRCRELGSECAGIVIACFSDPGLHAVREVMRPRRVPVFGISESSLLTALSLGQRFGVIAILQTSIARHIRNYGAMGILDRFAGEAAIGLGVTELSDSERTLTRMIEVGRHLIQDKGADVIVMGCAGMANYRHALEQALGVPVVEPTQAATSMALGHALLSRSSTAAIEPHQHPEV